MATETLFVPEGGLTLAILVTYTHYQISRALDQEDDVTPLLTRETAASNAMAVVVVFAWPLVLAFAPQITRYLLKKQDKQDQGDDDGT